MTSHNDGLLYQISRMNERTHKIENAVTPCEFTSHLFRHPNDPQIDFARTLQKGNYWA